MKTLTEVNETIYEKEKELIELKHERDTIMNDMDDKISSLMMDTNFKMRGITNREGREAFIKSQTVEERGRLVEVNKKVNLHKAEVDFLKRIFKVISENNG